MSGDPKTLGDSVIMEHTRVESDDKGRERFVLFDLHFREIASEWMVTKNAKVGKGKLIMAWTESVRNQMAADIEGKAEEARAKKQRARDESTVETVSGTTATAPATPEYDSQKDDDPSAYLKSQIARLEKYVQQALTQEAEITIKREGFEESLKKFKRAYAALGEE